jgi:hypothetical protein
MDDAMTVEAARAYLDQVTTFEPPPPGFDPFRAEARELAAYGYPRRPDPKTEPDLFMLWEKAFGSEHEFIRAELGIDEQLLKWRQQEEFGVGGWGGAVVEPSSYGLPASELANVAFAEWTLPGVSGDPAQPSTKMAVAFWVGVDGYILGRRQVVQGGVEAIVTGIGFATYVVWFEWYPAPPLPIINLDVRNGSRLAVLLCTPTADRGFLSIQNKDTGAVTSVGFPAPPGFTSDGTSAEWVVEAVDVGAGRQLPAFRNITFRNATAGTKNHSMDLSRASTTEITSSTSDLTHTSIDSGNVFVEWEGFR